MPIQVYVDLLFLEYYIVSVLLREQNHISIIHIHKPINYICILMFILIYL